MKKRNKKLLEIGSGFAVMGGGGYGNGAQVSTPRMNLSGRGRGFSSGSSNGSPNNNYTYSVKPLNHTLEPVVTPQEQDEEIMQGSKIIGHIINKFVKGKKGKLVPKEIEGVVAKIEKDSNNNILHYLVLDPKSNVFVKIDPTSAKLVKYETSRLMPITIDDRMSAGANEQYRAKTVQQVINEFDKSDNALKNLGIGKRALIENWLKEYGVENYKINDDFTIDVNGSVSFKRQFIGAMPDYIQFRNVKVFFSVQGCELTSLRGCPYTCQGFSCSDNKLESLEFCPKEIVNTKNVYNSFHCHNNKKFFSENYIRSLCKIPPKSHIHNE